TRFGEDEGYIQKIAVSSPYQGKGYGSMLMDHANEWFRGQGGIKTVHLYTQQDNHVAHELYKKHGFAVTGTTWHYFVPRDSLRPTGFYKCQEIKKDEIDEVGNKYEALPAVQIRRFLENVRYHIMTLKDKESQIIGVCRFTPSFPGCFPFLMEIPEAFDDFLTGLEPYSLPEFDYVRVTFTDIPKVAKLCEERGYKLHHKLFKMSLEL
ncbi:MAG: GNAT family N-acetyltransferase, partial [Candidatus Thorarchaeota archaeon]|nr:GNAT family N-acetyltransferase [Candidatus Thorarchaeota archaeon]